MERDHDTEYLLTQASMAPEGGDIITTEVLLHQAGADNQSYNLTMAQAFGHSCLRLDQMADQIQDRETAEYLRREAGDCLSVAINFKQLTDLQQ